MNKEGILVVISGFSGAGKGTLVKKLIETYDRYALSISMTTRNPRPGEMDGVHYFFTSKEDFEKTINEGGLIEYANYCGNYYGTPKEFVDRMRAEGKDVILEIEVQGALQIKEKFPTALLLFVTPPDAKELKKLSIFTNFEWDRLNNFKIVPPYVPKIFDVSNVLNMLGTPFEAELDKESKGVEEESSCDVSSRSHSDKSWANEF